MVKYKFWRKWQGHGDHSATEHIVRNSGHKRSLRRGGIIQVEISNKGLLSRKTFAKLYCLIDGHSLLLAKNSESIDKKRCVKLDLSKAKGFHVFQTATRGS
uniref:Uncharacterized protein n=1 Tax=Romanomermis culicivorax TaxID=13658 RepID=A0A915KMH8_ROMCU